jgi:hypothetical protein
MNTPSKVVSLREKKKDIQNQIDTLTKEKYELDTELEVELDMIKPAWTEVASSKKRKAEAIESGSSNAS